MVYYSLDIQEADNTLNDLLDLLLDIFITTNTNTKGETNDEETINNSLL